jgi:hypothetical protein
MMASLAPATSSATTDPAVSSTLHRVLHHALFFCFDSFTPSLVSFFFFCSSACNTFRHATSADKTPVCVFFSINLMSSSEPEPFCSSSGVTID